MSQKKKKKGNKNLFLRIQQSRPEIMGWDSKELNIDLNCCFSAKSFSDLLTEVSLMDDIPMKLSALNDYVYFLEQEQRKVDAFKRELPLSVILLNDGICAHLFVIP